MLSKTKIIRGRALGTLFTELKRRNIFRVAGVYAVVGWILMQVVAVMTPALHLPDWVDSFFAVALIIGFPIAVLFAWAFEMTPDGVKRTEVVAEDDSITGQTGRKLDYTIVGGLVLVAALVMGNRLMPQKISAPEVIVQERTEQIGEAIEDASIAVLPFADLSPSSDQEYFSDGIAEEILNVLVRVDNLKVASRTSAFGFKGQEALGIPTIAERLKVRHVLEGSVRKSGETLRITAQLIDASNDKHLWSQTYDRKLTAENIFAIQDEIANEIVRQLGIVMDGSEGSESGEADAPIVSVKADTKNLNAYELYLQAHSKFLSRDDLKGSMALFEQAVEADPDFARAWAGLAAVYSVAPSWNVNDKDYFYLATQSAQKAITLNPNLSMPMLYLAMLFPIKLTLIMRLRLRILTRPLRLIQRRPLHFCGAAYIITPLGILTKQSKISCAVLILTPLTKCAAATWLSPNYIAATPSVHWNCLNKAG